MLFICSSAVVVVVAAKKFDVLIQACTCTCTKVVLLLQLAIVVALVLYLLRYGFVVDVVTRIVDGTGTVELLLLTLEIHRAVIVWAAGLLQGRVGNLLRCKMVMLRMVRIMLRVMIVVILLEVNALAHLTVSEGKLALIKQITIHEGGKLVIQTSSQHTKFENLKYTSQSIKQTRTHALCTHAFVSQDIVSI